MVNKEIVKKVVVINKCSYCPKVCSLRVLCGSIPKECPLENTDKDLTQK